MKHSFPREFYIPKGSVPVKAKSCEAVAYIYGSKSGKPGAAIFFGKQAKPYKHYTFRSEAARESYIKECFESRERSEAYKKERFAERKAFQPKVEVGEIYRTSWGYEQTNVEFFEVVAFKGKTATLREIAAEVVETGWAQGKKTPLPGKYIGPEIQRRATQYGFKISECRTAFALKFTMVAGVKVYETSHYTAYA